jgi:2-polyprenyl-3-methyl-5-hydroxy-6-metoxy-1,4-benzoquinol methylase
MHQRMPRQTCREIRMHTPPDRPPAFADAAETWNRRYAGDDFLFGTEPNAWLREHAGSLPSAGRILSVADGEGRNSVWLAQQGFQVDAFDVAHRAVEKAQAFARRQGVSVNFALADVDGYAWPEAAYDGVAAIFVQFADPDTRARLFKRIVRSLKPGGVLVLQGYTPKQLEYRTGGPPILSHLYTRELLESAFSDLSIVELRAYEAEVQEGQGHSGRSALIGLVARR